MNNNLIVNSMYYILGCTPGSSVITVTDTEQCIHSPRTIGNAFYDEPSECYWRLQVSPSPQEHIINAILIILSGKRLLEL